jgi:hypothetical protein
MKFKLTLILTFFLGILAFSQNNGVIKGKVIDAQTREIIPYVNVLVVDTNIGGTTNDSGEFVINNIPLGYVKVKFSTLGYEVKISEDYLVTIGKSPYLIIELEPKQEQLEEVLVEGSLFKKSLESPISVQSLGIAEIEKNPGGNRDILKVIQSLPGVASNPGFRNDIIIRGGAPSENKFYIDGIEIPVINHFQTQGSSGGPVGIINADLIRKVDFYTSAFSANRGNALSSVVEFTQKEGNPDKLRTRATLGTSDAGITLDGPLGANTSFIASIRQSYLQFLFKALKLPFLPTYNDFQVNVKHKISSKNEISFIAIGAIDNFELNENVNDGVTDEDDLKRNNYTLSNIPIQEQWNYTIGASYKHFSDHSFQKLVVSRNAWKNEANKYFNNTNNSEDLLLSYDSKEIENKLRFENTSSLKKGYKLNFGVDLQNAFYSNSTYQKIANANGVSEIDFSSDLTLVKYGTFAQLSKKLFDYKLGISVGFRVDGADYNDEMKNLFNQFSPRISLSYELNKSVSINASSGIYYQLPAYTIMGYRDSSNKLINKENELAYIKAKHFVSGIEFKPNSSTKVTLEGFYKGYDNYPFSVRDEISLANLGSDFGVIGNEEVTSTSEGRAYGIEFLAQKKSYKGLYGIISYTFVKSEFKDVNDSYIASSWDNRHMLTITAGTKLKKNWEIGGKFRYIGGQPYTPYNLEASSIIENYNISNSGILDYTKLNSERFNNYHQLDLRIDKTWYWKKISLNFYFDIQNLYGKEVSSQPYLIPSVDSNGDKIVNPSDNTKYVLEEIENSSGTILPRIGFIIDF